MSYGLLSKGAIAEGNSIDHHCHLVKDFLGETGSPLGIFFHQFQWVGIVITHPCPNSVDPVERVLFT